MSTTAALALPNGARFFRCALQVNPYAYLKQHSTPTTFADETAYNAAMVAACQANGIEVIAVTDHYKVRTAASLTQAARAAGIHVLPGFEAVTKDGVHLLCLFNPDRDSHSLERVLGDCGIHDEQVASPTGKYDVLEHLHEAKRWGAICIAAHVAGSGGLLAKLSGQTRMNAWRSPLLDACSLPGRIADAPDALRPILENKNAEHRRDRPVAVLNAQDVSAPEHFAKPGAWTWIKMSVVSVEGLRQAFLDPDSRVRLSQDPAPEEHAEFLSMTWQGGFLDGAAIHFNENLNVLIGGRGTGKSTVVESLRYVLGRAPLGEEAKKTHDGIIKHVLRSGTKVSLLVRSHRPSRKEYLIERTLPNPPIVRDESGKVLRLTPEDIIPQAEVYGQHEISELTKSPEKLTHLLGRFVVHDDAQVQRKAELRRQLTKSRTSITDRTKELTQIEDDLAKLPGILETLRRYQEAGLEEKLKEQTLIVQEETLIKRAQQKIKPVRDQVAALQALLPIDRAFLADKAIEALPGSALLTEVRDVLDSLNDETTTLASALSDSLGKTEQAFDDVRGRWDQRKAKVKTDFEKILRELSKAKIDGQEFIRLREQVEQLQPLAERRKELEAAAKQAIEDRRTLLAAWEDAKAAGFRELERAAKKVSRQLADRVRVQVTFAGSREPLFDLLRNDIGGRLSEAIEILRGHDDLSLTVLVQAFRAGKATTAQAYGIPPAQADRLAQASPDVLMRIEELDLAPTTRIELNVAPEGEPASWQDLDALSTGQKATAVLLLLLLNADAPLVVDQPEDDLDNRFITDGVVPKMREEKRRRQFVFATHNANIPVLGDAELIVGLTASGEAGQGKARLPTEHMGSIDSDAVRELVEEVLEGGRTAFETRRLKYGF